MSICNQIVACSVDAGSVSYRVETRGVHVAGEEEGETLHGSPQRAEDVQNLHEAATAHPQVNTAELSDFSCSG